MATKKTASKQASKSESESKELAPWEQKMAELAEEAAESASSTAGGGLPKIGTRGGRFTIDGNEIDGDTIEVVVLDFVVDVTYYEDDFDPDDVTPPTASAIGRKENELVWHENSHPDYAGQELKDSPVFQWGSADKGRGKAAKSRRRLLVIDAEDLEDDIASAEVRRLMVPVTSGKEWDKYVKQVKAHGRAPCGVLTAITIKTHPKYQFELKFKMLGVIDGEFMGEVLEKRESVQSDLFAPYARWDAIDEEEDEAPKKSKAVARGAAKRGGKAKR